MDFNDPALEHLVNKITIALQGCKYPDELYRIPDINC